jgi:hypothetical protein
MQIDKIREMTSKLEGASDHSNAELIGSLESKLINLQVQLKDIREQREKGTLSHQVQQDSNASGMMNTGYEYRGRGRGFSAARGRSSGRFAGRSSYIHGGRSFAGRGRNQWVNNISNSNSSSSTSVAVSETSVAPDESFSQDAGTTTTSHHADGIQSEVIAQ